MKILIYFIIFFSFLSYVYCYNHIFMNIISIEFIIISLGMYMYMLMNNINMEYMMLMYFVMSVIESLIMLCLLVSYVMNYGSDNVKFLNIYFY